MRRFHITTVLVCTVMLGPLPDSGAATFPWKSELTANSSPELAAVDAAVNAVAETGFTAVPVKDVVFTREGFRLTMKSGTLYLEPPVDGAYVGAWFQGEAAVSYTPTTLSARSVMATDLGRETLDGVPVTSAYLFALGRDTLLASLAASHQGAASAVPADIQTYRADKTAMRQLGLKLTSLFIDRDGPAAGSAYVLFPMEEIRIPHSEEARLLYTFDPTSTQPISMSVFGHEEMVAVKPYKFRFYELSSCPSKSARPPGTDLIRSSVRVSLGTMAKSARQEARLDLRLAPGQKSLLLALTIQMVVQSVTGPDGKPLPFLQWKRLINDPDFDQTVLVSLGGTAQDAEVSVTVTSEGILFEPWFNSFYIVDEDDWFPSPASTMENDDFAQELELTIPKKFAGIGIGEIISDEVKGLQRVVTYRTTQPIKSSTFYYGDYTVKDGKADDIALELYLDRVNIEEQKRAKYTLDEIANAIKVFDRMFVPLDIRSLRVTSTPSSHGRGFEGLLLLASGGVSTRSSSEADLFRAHEVAHQWWGQYVRPRHWPEDRWLSEAFAEYSAMEFYKVRYDAKKALTLMKENWVQPLTDGFNKFKDLTGRIETKEGMTVYPVAAGTGNVYTKGPMVLNMLRYLYTVQKKGDDEFFAMLRDFLQTYRYAAAGTDDFQAMAEKHLGVKLDWFFRQWVQEGGTPVLKWNYALSERDGGLFVTLKAQQLQTNYTLVVPIYVHFGGEKMAVTPWVIEGPSAERTIKLPMKPNEVSLNDNFEALVILHKLGEDAATGG